MNQTQVLVTMRSELEVACDPREPIPLSAARTRCDKRTLDVLYGQLRTALRPASQRFGWSQETLEDAYQEILVRLFELRTPEVWIPLRQEAFGTLENADLRDIFLRVVSAVVEKLRNRHKVEIRPGSIKYDNGPNVKKRQRQDLQSDRHLGEHAAQIEDIRNHGSTEFELKLDVIDAINNLEPTARAIILRRIVEDESWRSIANDLGLPLKTVKNRYRHAMAQLTDKLRDYDNPKPAVIAEDPSSAQSFSDKEFSDERQKQESYDLTGQAIPDQARGYVTRGTFGQ